MRAGNILESQNDVHQRDADYHNANVFSFDQQRRDGELGAAFLAAQGADEAAPARWLPQPISA